MNRANVRLDETPAGGRAAQAVLENDGRRAGARAPEMESVSSDVDKPVRRSRYPSTPGASPAIATSRRKLQPGSGRRTRAAKMRRARRHMSAFLFTPRAFRRLQTLSRATVVVSFRLQAILFHRRAAAPLPTMTSSMGRAADSFRRGEFTSTRPTTTIGWLCGCIQGSAMRWRCGWFLSWIIMTPFRPISSTRTPCGGFITGSAPVR